MAPHPRIRQPPFPTTGTYPSGLSWKVRQSYNWLYNTTFPVKPYAFVALAAATYHSPLPESLFQLISKLTEGVVDPSRTGVTGKILASLLIGYLPSAVLRFVLKNFVFEYKGFVTERKPSLVTKLWAVMKSLLLNDLKLNTTDAFLPKLPLPELSDTIERYLASVKNFMTEEEFAELEIQARDFAATTGWKLQSVTWFYSLFVDNYVTPFWEKYVYLRQRTQLSIASSVAHVDLYQDQPANQAVRAAHVIYIEALSMLAIAKQQIQPLAHGLVYSGHYHRMYAGTRVPGLEIDHLESYGLSRHVVVHFKGCFYKLKVFDDRDQLLSTTELAALINKITESDDQPGANEDKIAALTFDNRASWHRNRLRFFVDNPVNAEALDDIEHAIVFLSLDDDDYDYDPARPEVLEKFMKAMLTGDGSNRWCDKSLNYIVSRNGRAGGMTEHSIGDGAEFDHIMENFCSMDINFLKYPDPRAPVGEPSEGLELPKKLKFDVSLEMKSEIDRVYSEYKPKMDDVDLACLIFREFGKGTIKKGRCSPDAFIQMAIQLANYRDQGKFVLTYESASARFYRNSRTETLRTVSDESCAFVKAMLDSESTQSERLSLLHKACDAHSQRNRHCMVGEGVDRHLFVLYVMSYALGYSHPFLEHFAAGKWRLSTSQPPTLTHQVDEDACVDNSWLGASFAAVTPDGYGICYRFAGNHSICTHITSYKSAANTDSHRFADRLAEAFREMAGLFEVGSNGTHHTKKGH